MLIFVPPLQTSPLGDETGLGKLHHVLVCIVCFGCIRSHIHSFVLCAAICYMVLRLMATGQLTTRQLRTKTLPTGQLLIRTTASGAY